MSIFVVMGVCGSGKTTVAKHLSEKMGSESKTVFYDGGGKAKTLGIESCEVSVSMRPVILDLVLKIKMELMWSLEFSSSDKFYVWRRQYFNLQCTYRDADDFHSEENKLKMASSIPLTDEDRIPWLLSIHAYIKSLLEASTPGIVTCSALKRHYRNILVYGFEALTAESSSTGATNSAILFVYLKGSSELISARLNWRKGHFMPPRLLESQFDILEEPDDSESHITVDIDCSIETLVDNILQRLIK